jgi:hypothetical protein
LSLAAVIMVIYLNQVLFTVYVIRVRHGDPSFIARYLPAGWFTLARGHAMEALARQFPDPGLLAPAVLRVQAFLELPLVVFAYLTVSRWFSAGAYRGARRLVWPASAAWTATFCLIEWSLHNPYTTDDIVIRIAAAIVVPLWAGRLAGPPPDRVPGLPALLVFAASTAALGLVVLTVYDTALLYNLGHLGARLPVTAAALAVLAAARVAAPLLPSRPPGPGWSRSPGRSALSCRCFSSPRCRYATAWSAGAPRTLPLPRPWCLSRPRPCAGSPAPSPAAR